MIAGEALMAFWTDITPPLRESFYDWQINEHMAERVGIPGFRRGRRYAAADSSSRPEFFGIYEADTIEVLKGVDYQNRLNTPTPWSTEVIQGFRNTVRAIARVVHSAGPGIGGSILTLRFEQLASQEKLVAALLSVARAPRVCGVHLCRIDEEGSSLGSAESKLLVRERPPAWILMIEATAPQFLRELLPEKQLPDIGISSPVARGLYALEFVRFKTAFSSL